MVSKNNEIVKKLIEKYRNNYIAHTSINCILQNHAPLEGSQLTIGEINVLIKNASDMINKYANKLFNKSYIFLVLFEYNDHEFILGAIQECHLKNKNYIQKLISKSK